MQESQNSNALHWILGAALLLIGLFVVIALVNVKSQADVVSTDVTITNASPTVDAVYVNATSSVTFAMDGTITPSSGTTKTVYVNGYITDTNGVGDISAVAASFYRVGQTCATDAPGGTDNNFCYKNSTSGIGSADCATSNVSSTQISFTCSYPLEYYADSTSTGGVDAAGNWIGEAYVLDSNGNSASGNSSSFEIGTLTSLNFAGSISYGTMGLGETTAEGSKVDLVVTQYGNDVATISVLAAADMSCNGAGSADIPKGNQVWSLGTLATGTALTVATVDTLVNLTYRTDDNTALTDNIYWGITIPSTGVSGTCTGVTTATVSAV